MTLTPQMVDYLIISAFEMLKVLSKHQRGEKISDKDLKLESWDETMKKLKELKNKNA